MNEQLVMKTIANVLRNLKEDPLDEFSPPLFKQIIENNIVTWTAITSFPTVCLAIGSSSYTTEKNYTTTTTQLQIYVYNKYRMVSNDLPDILSYPIQRIRSAINTLNDKNIIESAVISSARDNGTLQPYTVSELLANIKFIESLECT